MVTSQSKVTSPSLVSLKTIFQKFQVSSLFNAVYFFQWVRIFTYLTSWGLFWFTLFCVFTDVIPSGIRYALKVMLGGDTRESYII